MKLLLVMTVLATAAMCQQAQIAGLIRDPSGLNVGSADISVRNEQTGGRRQTRTNDSGFYTVASLNPGTYRILIRRDGFETIVREGVRLEVGDNARLDFTLRIGDSQTVVTVRGDAALMNTEDASIGTIIGRDIIDEMPLNGRGIQSLIELTPGVEAVPVTPDNAGQFSVNGQHSVSNYFTVDGVSANFGAGVVGTQIYGGGIIISQAGGAQLPANNLMGTFSNLVSPDALQEFKIQTSTFAPEFGRAPGAQVGFLTRSGTTRYAGSLFEYFRNDVFDANDWFSDQNGLGKTPLRFNNFGGTLAGPVRIPHLHRSDDRTFFFFSVESLVMRQPQPAQPFAVPTAQTRLSESPLSAPLYNSLPLPNLSGSTVPGWGRFAQGFSLPTGQQTWGLRLDHYFSDRLIGFFRYNLAPSHQTQEPRGLPLTQFQFEANTVMLTAGLTESIGSAFVNDLRANFSRQNVTDNAGFLSVKGASPFPVTLLFPQGESSQDSYIAFADVSSPAFPSFQLGLIGASRSRQIQAADQLSYTRGTHQFKFGADYRMFSLLYKPPRTSTDYYFTDLPGGLVTEVSEDVLAANLAYRLPAFSLYAQDTWHALPRLTIAYGLRWELEPAPRATTGDVSVYRLPSVADLSSLSRAPQGAPFYPTRYTYFAPRVGVAWQMLNRGNRKTVLRAGGGLFYDTNQSGVENVNSVPTSLNFYPDNIPLNALSNGATPSSVSRFPFEVVAARGYTLPRTWQWNLTLEQSFGQQTFSAAYTGAAGRRLLGSVTVPLYLGSPVIASEAEISGSYFSSSYDALQLQFNRRVGKRVHALVSYTWSHSIDNLSDQTGVSLGPQGTGTLLNPNQNRGDSDFDVRHSLHGALLFALPAPLSGRSAALLRNWKASTIFFVRTALPTSLLIFTYAGYEVRPDLVPGQPLYLYGSGYPGGKSFNGDAFAMPQDQTAQGDLGRNVARGLGAWQADVALHREFRLAEHTTVQFRAEAFNVFNHPNFANPSQGGIPQQDIPSGPNSGPGSGISQASLAAGLSPVGTLGQLNQLFQVGGPRSLQLALRLAF